MINQLVRTQFRPDGIFSEFWFDGDDKPFMVTGEHAYMGSSGEWLPKIPNGTFTCVRGIHYLHSGPVDTFEILGVKGHSGLLICHIGNFPQANSNGCVLSGRQISTMANGDQFITASKETYKAYIARLAGVTEFDLVVS